MRADAIRGLSTKQIQQKYYLPEVPSFITEVHVPAGTRVRTGRVNANFGVNAGAVQYELLDRVTCDGFPEHEADTLNWKVQSGCLYVGERRVPLPFPVVEAVEAGPTLVVRVEVPAGERLNRNVYRIAGDGSIVWQREESPHGTEKDKPYMRIWNEPGGELRVGNWNGVYYRVDLATGSITPVGLPR